MEIKQMVDIGREVVLIVGMIFICAYAIKSSNDSRQALQEMNNQVHMMFLKS